jgi:membrane AbrB-like protein
MTTGTLIALLVAGAAGALLGRLFHLPVWPMTGAIAGAAALQMTGLIAGSVPAWWGVVAQVVVGSVVGSRVNRGVLDGLLASLAPSALAVIAIIGTGIGLGLVIAHLGFLDRVEALLGMVPGGIGEMVAASTALGGDSSVVAGMHLIRLVIVFAALPAVVVWLRRRHGG